MQATPKLVPTTELHFDHQNPRLAEFSFDSETLESEILETLWVAMDVRELIQSISASGFFPHEPLIVAIEGGKKIVIEGNRRLAAVKVLRDPELATANDWQVDVEILAAKKHDLERLPVVFSKRNEAWRSLGFKHVNGPQKWSSFAKAKYIANVHRTYDIGLSDIAQQIGDRHRTVERLYRGLIVLEQAERARVFDFKDRFRTRFAFSHLYTGLGYDGIAEFLGIEAENVDAQEPVPNDHIERLRELLLWLYGSKKEPREPLVRSQNPHLRQLSSVVTNIQAVTLLRDGRSLEEALEISRPSSEVFEEALLRTKTELQRARGYATHGYDGSDQLLRVAGTIAELADDLYRELERKSRPKERKRLTEE